VLFAVAQEARSPGSRYRVYQYLPYYRAAGLECSTVAVQDERSTWRSIHNVTSTPFARMRNQARIWFAIQRCVAGLLPRVRQFDRVYLYRIPIPGWARQPLLKYRHRLLFDYDDALDQPEVWHQDVLGGVRRRLLQRGLRNAVEICRTVVTSNERNATYVREIGGRPVVVPTSVELARFAYRDRAKLSGPLPVLGWMGTPSTAAYVRAIEGALRRLASRRPVTIRLVGSAANPFRSLEADVRAWALETENDELRQFDIGLMPMPDTPWTRGKAALKALQYGASGAPTVGSWTATNAEILGENEGAVLCGSEDDWIAALEDLLSDPGRRSALGRRARQRVESLYSVEGNAPRLIALIKEDHDEAAGPGGSGE
jgi:glycosyltransferase involved in cell wall biosynthesis